MQYKFEISSKIAGFIASLAFMCYHLLDKNTTPVAEWLFSIMWIFAIISLILGFVSIVKERL